MTFAEDKTDKLFTKFKTYCKPKQNITVERYCFNTRTQEASKTIDQYVNELKLIAKNCSYGDLEDQLIRDRIICGIRSEMVKQRLLRAEDLTLDKAIICRAEEQYLSEEPTIEAVHGLHLKAPRGKGKTVDRLSTRDKKRQTTSED